MYVNVGDASLSMCHTGQAKIFSLTTVGIEPATFGLLVQCSQLSYEGKSVRVCDISELNLVPSISVSFHIAELTS